MKVTIVRHGQTNYNVARLFNSDPSVDVHLTSVGINEAKLLAKQLRDEPFDAIFISELPRTKQTAEYINIYHRLPFQIDQRLNDINTGFEGKSITDYHALRLAAPDPYTFKLAGAESSQDVYDRIAAFIQDLKHTKYHNILIVTSKICYRHFINIIDQLDPRIPPKQSISNASILVREI